VENVKRQLTLQVIYVPLVKMLLNAAFGIFFKSFKILIWVINLSQKPIKGLLIWCQVCSHSGHIKEIEEWFAKNKECPVGCGHRCFDYYKQINLF